MKRKKEDQHAPVARTSPKGVPSVQDIGWPDGVAPGDWNAVVKLASEVIREIRDIDIERAGAMQWEDAIEEKSTDRVMVHFKPGQLFRHLTDSAVSGDDGARLGLLLLAHLHRAAIPTVRSARALSGKKDVDGDSRKRFSLDLKIVTFIRANSKKGKMAAYKAAAAKFGLSINTIERIAGLKA